VHIATLRAQARPRKHDRAADTSSYPRGLSQSCICAWCHGEEPAPEQGYSNGSPPNEGTRADETGPCRGCATAAFGSSVDRIMKTCTAHTPCSAFASVARNEEPIGQHLVRNTVWCCRGRPATNPTPQLSTYAGVTHSIVTSCKRSPFWVLIAIRSHD